MSKDLRSNPKKYRRLWQKTEKAWRVQPRADERPSEPEPYEYDYPDITPGIESQERAPEVEIAL